MDPLTDIIQRCHHRRQKPLQQQKTVATPAMLGRGYLHQYTVYCAHKYPVLLDDLEQAEISFMPIGRAPRHDGGPKLLRAEKFLKSQGARDWAVRRWDASWGINIYTGMPSERNGARWHDLHFKYEALCIAPDAVFTCIEALVNGVSNPLLTITRSGGLRFSCRVSDYLHPEIEEERLYVYKHTSTVENPQHRDVYLEIFGEKSTSCWDGRHEILFGDLLNPPMVSKEVLFAPIDALRAELHKPVPQATEQSKSIPASLPSLGSRNLNLAKDALLKRGFSYVREENGVHHWIQYGGETNNTDILLWESEGTVWIRTSTPDAGFPLEATPITDVWSDTRIVAPTFDITLPISDKMLAVREGKLSPLAIRRPSPVLQKPETVEKNPIQIQHILDGTARILGLTVEADKINTYEIESHLLNSNSICLSMPTTELAEEAEQRFQEQNVPSVASWKPRNYLWDQVKEIPIEERIASPFQHGNICEDPERSDALEKKGGDPSESICPQCSVYMACKERGYLSQPTALRNAKVQILTIPELFFNPQYTELAEDILGQVDGTEDRVCIINNLQVEDLFFRCRLSKNVLEEWCVTWKGQALGNFAQNLLNALEIKGKPHSDAVKQVRATMQAFEWQEKEIVRQMCQVKVKGSIVESGFVDAETGQELARFTIEFEGGASAYIPLDDNALDILMARSIPSFPLHAFTLNEDTEIPMSMAQAIRLGILDIETLESIEAFPTVCPNPNWTFWHQMKHLFAYYTRDTHVPIQWDHKVLRFWIPPALHPSVKRLVLMSPTLSERHLRRAFPDDEVEAHRIESTPWVAGNQVFQIRTGLYPREEILDYSNDWGVTGISEIGQRFLAGISAEVERDSSIKHAIFANQVSGRKLANLLEKSSTFSIISPARMVGIEPIIEAADVIWIVGTPPRDQGFIWRYAQNLFGNDENPLCHNREMKSLRYEDERVQSVYEANVVDLLTRIIGQAQLNRLADKKIVLISGMQLPDITDRPETLLFDWEDFEIAGGLDKLPEVIATRQHFETEKANLTVESGRDKVQQILGCSRVHANRILRDLRGGKLRPATFREQILSLLADGEKKSAEVVAAIDGNPKAINHELVRLANVGEIVKVRWGVYALPQE